jgi:peptidoglycan-associated lipoprotein
MHRSLSPAGLLAALVLLSAGCGHKAQPETPAPSNSQDYPNGTASITPTLNSEPIADKGLDQAQRAILEDRISFDYDRSDLTPAAKDKLSAKAEILRMKPSLNLRIEGHADERGSDEYNLALSNRRSVSAMRFLVSQGISQSRFETVGYGEEKPLDPGENEAAWAKNRRDDFRVSADRLAQQ